MQVCLTYFKKSGKYYSSGVYDTSFDSLHEIWDEVRTMLVNGTLPDLLQNTREFHILVDVPNHEYNHPRLIFGK